jgi:cytoskeletal protein CcmA (bactofilin family)
MLLPTARVLGDIRTPELIIQNGVVLEGKCVISTTTEKSVRDLIMSEYKREE